MPKYDKDKTNWTKSEIQAMLIDYTTDNIKEFVKNIVIPDPNFTIVDWVYNFVREFAIVNGFEEELTKND